MSTSKLNRQFRACVTMGLVLLLLYPTAGQKARSPEIERLVADLGGERTTDDAAKNILLDMSQDLSLANM